MVGDLAEVSVAQEGVPGERTFRQEWKDGRKQAGGGHLPLHPCPSRVSILQAPPPAPKQEVLCS